MWCEAARTATMLDNIMVHKGCRDTPHYLFYNQDPPYAEHLKIFGEICIACETRSDLKKTDSQGCMCMFLGYSDNHPGDTYRLLHDTTNKVIYSRDVQWL